MKTTLWVIAWVLAGASLCQCSTCPSTAGDQGAVPVAAMAGGSGGGGAPASRYTITSLDGTSSDPQYMDLAVDATVNRVGIAYFVGVGYDADGSSDAPFYDLKYVEWKNGVAGVPELVDRVQRLIGVSIAFDPITGEPAIGYLGGGSDGSLYWFQSDAEVAIRNGGTWSHQAIATTGFMVTCGNPISDTGTVVGLWSALQYDSTGQMWFCYRDVHSAQFPVQDWAGSDVECWHGDGTNPASMIGECTQSGGDAKYSWGGHIHMVMANDQPAITYEQEPAGGDVASQNVFFQPRAGTGWQSQRRGFDDREHRRWAALAHDSMLGFGIAAQDASTGVLFYTSKSPSAQQWSQALEVFGAGTGGLFPSLAIDPTFHEPAIAFFNCSPQSGVNDLSTCLTSHQEVGISQLTDGVWNHDTVDTVTARRLRLGFLPASGKRVLAYRILQTGELEARGRELTSHHPRSLTRARWPCARLSFASQVRSGAARPSASAMYVASQALMDALSSQMRGISGTCS